MAFHLRMLAAPDTVSARWAARVEREKASAAELNLTNRVLLLLVEIMDAAGALSHETPPDPPQWTEGIDEERALELEAVIDEPALEADLSAAERRAVRSMRSAVELVRRTPSLEPRRVPAFKFASCDGWIVNDTECRILAEALSSYAAAFDASSLAELESRRRAAHRAALAEMRRLGFPTHAVEAPLKPLEGPLREWTELILDFAEFHAVAAGCGGYRVL
jgi:hypothetical protein